MGYELAPGSFLDIAPFNDVVFLNDTLDTIASGSIHYLDIVPNITISALFDVLRKFNVEPMPNETLKTIRLVSFNEILTSSVQADLSDSIHKECTVHYHHDFKQLKLSSQRVSLPERATTPLGRNLPARVLAIFNNASGESSLVDILTRFPEAYICNVSGGIRSRGFHGEREVDREIGSLSLDYFAGDDEFSVDEKRFPNVVPKIIRQNSSDRIIDLIPYCGRGRFVQSSLAFSDDTYSELSDERELRPMLCLSFIDSSRQRTFGTLSNYNLQGQKLWDFSLMFNGEDGIFERFWRSRDNLLRNALLQVEFDLLLSEKHKFTLSAVEKVMLKGQEYLIEEINYTPEQRDIKSCRFLSVRQQHPILTAKTISERIQIHPFRWVLRSHRNFTIDMSGRPTGSARVNFLAEPTDFFPPPPTAAQFAQGGRHHERQFPVEYGVWDTRTGFTKWGEGIVTTWLEAVRT